MVFIDRVLLKRRRTNFWNISTVKLTELYVLLYFIRGNRS